MNLSDITEGPDHQKKIAIDTVKNPDKWLLGGPNVEEAEKVLKDRYGYTDDMIAKLKEGSMKADKEAGIKWVDDPNWKKLHDMDLKMVKDFVSHKEVNEAKKYVLVHDKKIIAKGTRDEMRDKGNAMRKHHGAVSDLFVGFYDVSSPKADKFKIGAVWDKQLGENSQLTEIAPLVALSALATAVRLGAPHVAKFLARKTPKVAADAVKNSKPLIKKGAEAAGQVAKGAGGAVLKHPVKATILGVGAKVYMELDELIDDIKELVGDLLDMDVIKALAEVAVKYALPATAIVALLYGGKKLADYIRDNEDEDVRYIDGEPYVPLVTEDSESVWRGIDMDDTLYRIVMDYWDSLPHNMKEELKAVLDESQFNEDQPSGSKEHFIAPWETSKDDITWRKEVINIIVDNWKILPKKVRKEIEAAMHFGEGCGKPHKKKTYEGFDSDESIAREVLLIARNDASWYKRQYVPIIKNLMRKRAKGIYDHELAKKLWRHYIDNIVKSHPEDFGPSRGIPGTIRNMAAAELADFEKGEMDLGNWDNILKEGEEPLDEILPALAGMAVRAGVGALARGAYNKYKKRNEEVDEGKMKDLALDLQALSDEEFEDKWETKKSDWELVTDKRNGYYKPSDSAWASESAGDGPTINQLTDEDLAEYLGVDVKLVKKDRESAEDAAYDKTADMVGETGGLLSEYDLDPTDLDDYHEKMKTLRGLEKYMGSDPELDQAIKRRYANLAKWKMAVGEEAPNPYAIGMSKAMKMTGDKPPLKKKTINKAHEIAKAIMKDSKMDKKQVNENVQITSINNAGEGVVEGESGAELHVIAQGDKDVAVLADLLKLSGLRSSGLKAVTPQDCGIAEDDTEEDIERGHWPSNAPEPKTVDAETQTVKMSGGLNGPKDKRHLRGDSNFLRPEVKMTSVKEELEESLWDLYKEFDIDESKKEK
jgi:hypothetical protein